VSGEAFSTHYSVYGRTLDIDELLRKGAPVGRYRLWHRGEPGAIPGRPTVTSGIRLHVFGGKSHAAMARAVQRFLKREEALLRAVARLTEAVTWAGLSSALYVYAMQPVTVIIPPDLFRDAARAGVSWSVTGYPCQEDEE
jgi:hypothetical protein